MSAQSTSPGAVRETVSAEEWAVREDLAALCRFIADRKWDDHIFSNVSARVPGNPDQFLLQTGSLCFDEVTASSFVKVDENGQQIAASQPELLKRAPLAIDPVVYRKFPHAQCVIHLHTPYGVAVSAQEQGLLPVCQHAMILGPIAYHDYQQLARGAKPEEEQKVWAQMAQDFGECKAMILRNHGTLVWGETVAEAFYIAFKLERACEYQVLAQSGGAKLNRPAEAAIRATRLVGFKAPAVWLNGMNVHEGWRAVRRRMDRISSDYRS